MTTKGNPSIKFSLNSFKKQLVGHNRSYRIFTLITIFLLWGDFADSSASIFDRLIIVVCGIIPTYFITLYIIDKQFYKYIQVINNRMRNKQIKQDQQTYLDNQKKQQNIDNAIKIIKNIPLIIFFKSMPYLTRLPILEDHWKNKLGHHKNQKIFNLQKVIEETDKQSRLNIHFIDIDNYHVAFHIKLKPGLTLKQAKQKINKGLKLYFNRTPSGIELKSNNRHLQILVPTNLLRGEV